MSLFADAVLGAGCDTKEMVPREGTISGRPLFRGQSQQQQLPLKPPTPDSARHLLAPHCRDPLRAPHGLLPDPDLHPLLAHCSHLLGLLLAPPKRFAGARSIGRDDGANNDNSHVLHQRRPAQDLLRQVDRHLPRHLLHNGLRGPARVRHRRLPGQADCDAQGPAPARPVAGPGETLRPAPGPGRLRPPNGQRLHPGARRGRPLRRAPSHPPASASAPAAAATTTTVPGQR